MAHVPTWGVLLFIGVPLLPGCRKPDEDLGLDLLPGDELGVVFDTAQVRAYVFADTAVRTSGLTRNLVGSYLDPEFGLVRAGLVAQVRLTTNNIGQNQDNSGLEPDSIVLSLAFELPNYGYGNLNAQLFRVHELTEDLSLDSVYHTDDMPQVDPEDLVQPHAGLIVPDPISAPEVGGVTAAPQLRIRLRSSLARRFLDVFGTPDLVDNAAFLNFFKGIHVSVDNGSQGTFQGGILHFNTISSASKITVYYKNMNSEPDLARTVDFAISSNSVRYTVVEHDRSQALDPSLLNALSDTSQPAPLVYLQTLGGLRTAVRFPDLRFQVAEGRGLSKAELVVPVAGTFYPYYPPPAQVFVFRKNSSGVDTFLPDQLQGLQSIGGAYGSVTNSYRFNITRYVQGVFNGTIPDNGIELVAGSTGVSANRVILCGPEHPDTPMHLQLTFTTY